MSETKEFSIMIRWGTKQTRNDNIGCASTYSFKTEAEFDAFMQGVEEACGWLEYEVVEEEDEA